MARISLGVCLLLLVTLSTVYEVHGTFLFRHYMRRFPRRAHAFAPFACHGMLKFVSVLEHKCPLKPEYKNFFGKLKTYMSFIQSASGSKTFNVDLKGQAEGLHNAMSAMTGKGGSGESSKVMDVLLSMGKTLGETQRSSSTTMSFAQRKELIISMAKWARTIGQFVASTASKTGASIDISSLGLDGIDANAAAGDSPTGGASPTGGSSPTSGGTSNTGAGTSKTGAGTSKTGAGTTTTGAGTSNTGAGTSTDTDSSTPGGAYVNSVSSTGSKTSSGGSVDATQTTNGGTSTCTKTSKCSSGGGGTSVQGGGSFKGSINYQQQSGGQANSQQTATTTSDE